MTSDPYEAIFKRLRTSSFRAKFHLDDEARRYVHDKSLPVVEQHARDFISTRLAPAVIANDGKQTPWRGHPVFIAQHACAICCRGCLQKWYGIKKGRELTADEQSAVVAILMAWIKRETS